MALEQVIFSSLLYREDYGRKVIPFLKSEYFQDPSDRVLFDLIDNYVGKYNRFPNKEALAIELGNISINQQTYDSANETLSSLQNNETTDLDWLTDQTEKFCQEKAVYNALMKSIQILDGKDEKLNKGMVPQLLAESLAVSFDTNIGHDYFDDAAGRYEYYIRTEDRIPFALHYMNLITKGGFAKKTLNILMAGTNVGKSLAMCNFAASNLLMGKNVLYITMEMAEEEIAKRIDANVLDIPMDDFEKLPENIFQKKIERIKGKTAGKLIVKEYPTSSAGAANFRHLLNELRLKKNFTPDIIYIDYLNICMSSRVKQGGSVNSYTYIKAIAEELRALAVEFNAPIVSATQTTRGGFSNSDMDITDISESFGLAATADFLVGLITSEELQSLNQLMVKQLKNRYADKSRYTRFVIGIDRAKMRFYDVEESSQDLVDDNKPVMDKTEFGNRDDNRNKKKSKFDLNAFEGFK